MFQTHMMPTIYNRLALSLYIFWNKQSLTCPRCTSPPALRRSRSSAKVSWISGGKWMDGWVKLKTENVFLHCLWANLYILLACLHTMWPKYNQLHNPTSSVNLNVKVFMSVCICRLSCSLIQPGMCYFFTVTLIWLLIPLYSYLWQLPLTSSQD